MKGLASSFQLIVAVKLLPCFRGSAVPAPLQRLRQTWTVGIPSFGNGSTSGNNQFETRTDI